MNTTTTALLTGLLALPALGLAACGRAEATGEPAATTSHPAPTPVSFPTPQDLPAADYLAAARPRSAAERPVAAAERPAPAAAAAGQEPLRPAAEPAPTFRDGVAAFERGDEREALRIFRLLAERGNANAALNVGMLTRGDDPAGGLRWIERAARMGDANAAYELGAACLKGEAEGGLTEGFAWLLIGREGGSADARDVVEQLEAQVPAHEIEAARARAAQVRAELRGDRSSGATGAAAPRATTSRRDEGLASRRAARPDARTVELSAVTLRDPEVQNIESHKLLVPKGWAHAGGVVWTPETFQSVVHLDLAVSAPDGREARLYPGGAFTWIDGDVMPQFAPRPGALDMGRLCLPPTATPGDFVLEHVLPRFRPGARQVRVLKRGELRAVADAWRQSLAPLLQQQQQTNAMFASMGSGGGSQTTVETPVVRVAYTENGRGYEEEFSLTWLMTVTHMPMAYSQGMYTYDYWVQDVKSVRAPEGRLDDELPLLLTVANSPRPTELWQANVDAVNRELLRITRETHQMTMAQMRKTSRLIFQTGEEIRAMNRDSWEKQQASSDRLARAWSNTMREVDDYVTSDGTVWSLDNSYDRVFTNSLGDFVFTDDQFYDPNQHSSQTWEPVQRVEPMGAAANW